LRRSVFKLLKNLSITALSQQFPRRLILGVIFNFANKFLNSKADFEHPDLNGTLTGSYLAADVETIKTFIIKELHRPLSDLKLIVVTHMHPDHAGAAHVLRKKTYSQIACANVPGHWYTGLDGLLMHLTDMALTRWVAKRKNKPVKNIWYSSKLKPDIKINDGEILPGFTE
jgi:glyoxylase-like metal-dependent hydrolase (beta-lactamase superfamily II)